MAARKPVASSSNDSQLASFLMLSVAILVGALVLGGYWMQQQRADQAELRQQAAVYETYLYNTRNTPAPAPEAPSRAAQAQQVRQYLLDHPAVTPGPGFNRPGVQSTGKTIVDAIDSAKAP
ncbi:hypothetical protein N7340_14360 [Comamonas aquatica]|uniref:hypothetical protein n=1 Tax=Comamonas aquatica TaxID=225991 RepID=UPI002447D5CF|nr:hypothetical protein [Comamonas aquatica]MDH0372949.1 hypothetical protein [Comamonas aquatica]